MRISKLANPSPLSTAEFIQRAIATHPSALQDVKAMLADKQPKVLETASQNQLDFWAACYLVPRGFVASYGTLSRVVQGARGEPYAQCRLARAAGRFMSENVLAPVVPCHRVVGASGNLTGFKGETTRCLLANKAKMLTEEGVPVEATSNAFVVRASCGKLL